MTGCQHGIVRYTEMCTECKLALATKALERVIVECPCLKANCDHYNDTCQTFVIGRALGMLKGHTNGETK